MAGFVSTLAHHSRILLAILTFVVSCSIDDSTRDQINPCFCCRWCCLTKAKSARPVNKRHEPNTNWQPFDLCSPNECDASFLVTCWSCSAISIRPVSAVLEAIVFTIARCREIDHDRAPIGDDTPRTEVSVCVQLIC